ncbi:related to RSM26-mitochondrial ribosomal, small subunit [Lecanosticta acicola]|uniref:Related to RSM26-mitochondrial ribosomal, small subunit n=1 Tax=Lecanosticta acicola TaxID=111012 RepID=A0AAI8YT52_9PEZI|nr:related to RSM26-mitochondrial ribosomal, small subunit [Lecanosticta acicola]
MITRRLLRPARAFAVAVRSSTPSAPARTFSISHPRPQHNVPTLNYHEHFEAKGVNGLFDFQGYEIAWTQYQTILTEKLNELVAGEPFEHALPQDLIMRFARDPMNAAVFNYASAAHNNHHFFKTLSPSPLRLSNCPALETSLISAFGSMETLRMTFLDTAAAMFGPGYVWLVWTKNPLDNSANTSMAASARNSGSGGGWRILTTYLAGTPYAGAGYHRQQSRDMNTQSPFSQPPSASQSLGAFGRYSDSARASATTPPGGTIVHPVLCVSTWEHTYIYNYGLMGKREYLEKWWDVIDWGVVDQETPTTAKSQLAFSR